MALVIQIAKCVLKTNVCVPMALQQRAQIVLPMVLTFVRLVPVNLTKLATHALDALRAVRVNTKQEHCVMAAEAVIPKHVLKTFVLVPQTLTSQQRAQIVLPMVLISVRHVPLNITKLAAHALDALQRVAPAPEKRLLAFRHRIVFVLKTFVLVPMASKQRAKHVLPMVLTFVRLVSVDFTKLATHARRAPVAVRVNM
jgi:hypothetical protein